jgi:hypothetical protein
MPWRLIEPSEDPIPDRYERGFWVLGFVLGALIAFLVLAAQDVRLVYAAAWTPVGGLVGTFPLGLLAVSVVEFVGRVSRDSRK